MSDNKVTITMEDTGEHLIIDVNGTIPDDSMVMGVASLVHSVLVETKTPLSDFMTRVLTVDIGANISGSVIHYPHVEPKGGTTDENL